MKIRLARQADLRKGLAECLSTLAPTEFKEDEDWKIGFFFDKRKERGVKTFVMIEDSKVIGTYSVIVEPKFLRGGSFVGHIEDVAVHPNWQGKKLGKALIDHAIEYCRKSSCYKIVLYCSPEVMSFYTKSGFYDSENYLMRLDFPGVHIEF